ncbi:hypothetical protein JGU71_28420 [Antrihabitans sp. YC3-6]|uniref:Uncharacterized protein n=1 Tax=Antrihabitans stalagmiti TaxID=2799499 RepID=A0A934NX13_9NOCA|nr:hypothetical protein [Antrihabitans stalagmiti]MBJ8342822.1 hypothetical protein [Antrihabitans stalagmiti]
MSVENDASRAVGEELRAALEYSTGDPKSDDYIRGSLRAGVVGDDPYLVDIFEQVVGPEQAEVDLHLTGPGVRNHSTNAHHFAQFVSGISEAVKETAKEMAGKGRYSEGLVIEGATPGSVRVVLRAPEPKVVQDQTIDERTAASSVDSDALRAIAAILTHASDKDPNSPFVAELAELPVKARRGLKRAVTQSRKAGWLIEGTVRQRQIGAGTVLLSAEGAMRLALQLESGTEKRTTEKAIGRIDGFRRSLGTLYFIPDGGQPFIAGVKDSSVATRVTELFVDPDEMVEAIFHVVESLLPGAGAVTRRSRVLVSIKRSDVGEQGDFEYSD